MEDCHFLLCAGGTLILGTGVIARCICCFPCRSKGCCIWSQLATGKLELIIALAIVVAAKATQVPHVGLGDRDHHVLDEVIVDNEAEVSAEQDTRPMWVDLDLSLTQDGGEVVGDGIHHDICPFSFFKGQGDPIDFHRQRLDPGDLSLLPRLLLDCDHKSCHIVTCAGLGEDVGASSSDVEGHPIKGNIGVVTCGYTGAGQLQGRLDDITDDLPMATIRTGSIMALHSATREALAHLLLCGVECLSLFVVDSMVAAATVGHGDTLVTAEHEAILTCAALTAPPLACGRVSATSVLAGVGADLIGAVGRTGNMAEIICPPPPDGHTSSLACSGVEGNDWTHPFFLIREQAGVMDAALEVLVAINMTMTCSKRSIHFQNNFTPHPRDFLLQLGRCKSAGTLHC